MKPKQMVPKGTMKRLLRMLFSFYPVALPLVLLCVVFSAMVSAIPSIFMQNIIAVLEQNPGAGWPVIGTRHRLGGGFVPRLSPRPKARLAG